MDDAAIKEAGRRWSGYWTDLSGTYPGGGPEAIAIEILKKWHGAVKKPYSKYSHGRWQEAVEIAKGLQAPPDVRPNLRPLWALLSALSHVNDGQEFPGAARDLVEATKIPLASVSRFCRKLGGLGYLERVMAGTHGKHATGQANVWKWHPVRIEGGAPWAPSYRRIPPELMDFAIDSGDYNDEERKAIQSE
jgi:hypothetical protein